MKKVLLVLLVILVSATAFYVRAGYYNGPVFQDVPASLPDPTKPAIVILSGDMGNRIGMTPRIAARLHRHGYAVTTVNSLTFFSPRRTAREAAGLIVAAMQRAMHLGRTDSAILIGQSFGADMLHAGLSEVPEAMRRQVRSIVLVVPGHDIVFRASPIELAGIEIADRQAYPTASRLTWAPLTCISGKEERGSLCPELHMPNLRRIVLPGGHNLQHDDAALAAAILPAIGSE